MANGIKYGNKILPIIGTLSLQGEPGASLPNEVYDMIDLAAVCNRGALLGYEYNNHPPEHSGPGDPDYYSNILTTSYVSNGVTDFHDSLTMRVGPDMVGTVPPLDDMRLTWHLNTVQFYKGSTAYGSQMELYTCGGYVSYTTFLDQEWTYGAAYRYNFPEAEEESGRVNAYLIVFANHELRKRDDGTVYSEEYSMMTYFIVNLPYINVTEHMNTYYEEEDAPEDEEPYEPSEPQPITPNIDNRSDQITIPADPSIGVTDAGFINVYHPSSGALYNLGNILFPDPTQETDLVRQLLVLCEVIANQNLINYVIDCHVIPVAPIDGNNANIKVGFRDTEISVPRVVSDYVNVSCGALQIPEYFANFADYLTKAHLYLPFVGFVDIKPEYWQSGTLYVDYKFNVIDGSFMCYVRSTSSKSKLAASVIASYSGNACMHFPVTGVNYANMVSGLVGAAVAVGTSKSPTAALGAAYSAANVLAQGGDPQQSNGYNSTAALLGVRTPYLVIERPVQSWSSKFPHDKGLPSNIATLLANVTGFTTIDDIDLSGIPFTEGEITELRALLKEGVYF